ncbi:MAG TPA: sulfite exporter TauE/SafE family protein [Ferruginibacter sp.]|nr:sulfite exporter TauE/SafE family protein [Ferruginibacter sp.]
MEIAGYLLSALVGISLGLIGGGGSILMVPILVYVFMLNPVMATSYSLFVVGTTSLFGAINNYRKGLVSIKTALLFGISSITTVFITRKFIMPVIPEVLFNIGNVEVKRSMAIMVLFAILMLMASIAMIKGRNENVQTETKTSVSKFVNLLLYGIMVGLATGLLGAGGGFLIIPALVLLLQMPMKKAVGTSLFIIALNSLIGFTGDIGNININWKFLGIITTIAVTGIFIGGALAKKIDGHKLKKAFGWFVLVMGSYIIIKELFF